MLLSLGALLLGLAVLYKAAEHFVMGAGRLSFMLRLSPVVVGAVVIGFGTSAPELLVSGLAAAQGAPEIAVGNVVGSNIANLTLVAALAALLAPLAASSRTLRREAPLSALAVLLFAVLLQGGLGRLDGLVLLVALAGALAWIVRASGRELEPVGAEAEGLCGDCEGRTLRGELVKSGLALLGVVAAAQLIVTGARGLAEASGIDEGFVGLTLVAVGTSLPEIVTAVHAARRGESELVVGNLFGSNIFNSLGIGGAIGLVGPGEIDEPGLTVIAAGAMVVSAGVAWLLLGTGKRLVRWEALVLLAAYAALLPFVAR